MHFGAGRLGLGLVLPAMLESDVPFAILQRPSKEWAGLAQAEDVESITVMINGGCAVPASRLLLPISRCPRYAVHARRGRFELMNKLPDGANVEIETKSGNDFLGC